MNEISNNKSTIKAKTNDILKRIEEDKYVITSREKNTRFMRKYRLFGQEVKKLLLSITAEEYDSEQFDNDTLRYGTGTVIIYIMNRSLTDFHGETSNVEIYIKIKFKDEVLPIISLHETEK